MPTPGQSNTTDLDVLNAVLTQLHEVDGLNTGNCYLSAEAMFLPLAYMGNQYVQVVPGPAEDRHAKAGWGKARAQVRVVAYKQLFVDLAEQDTKRLADASEGLLVLVQSIYDKLCNNFLGGILNVPLYPMRRAPANPAPVQANGWASIERIFECEYRVSYPNPQATS